VLAGMVVFSLQGPAQASALANACARSVPGSEAMSLSRGGECPVAGSGRRLKGLVWLALPWDEWGWLPDGWRDGAAD
jgi:hypothetical protein